MFDFSFTNEFSIGDIIAFLCLLGSVFIYFKFDKKLKIQKEQINEQQIRLNKINIEKEDSLKKAELHLSVISIKDQQDVWLFVIDNRGLSPATNIRIDMELGLSLLHKFVITSIQPNQIYPVYKFRHSWFDTIGLFKSEIKWDDFFQKDNTEELISYSNKYEEYNNTLSHIYGDNYLDLIKNKASF